MAKSKEDEDQGSGKLAGAASGAANLALEVLAPEVGAVVKVLKGFGDALGSALSGIGKMVSGLANSFASGISAAANIVVGPFQSLAGAVGPFVQALNPSLMMQLGRAFESLQATIGVALMPVVEVLIGGIRQAAGVLLPAMQAMAPVMRTIAQTVIQLLMPAFRLISSIVTSLAPVFQLIADMAKELASGINALSVIGRALAETFASWLKTLFGGQDGMKSFLGKFRDAIHSVVEALLKLTAYIAKAFGGFDFIQRMADNLRKIAGGEGKEGGAAHAPKEVGFKTFEDISKTMAQAAFIAQPGGVTEEETEIAWLEKLANSLEEVKQDQRGIVDFIVEGLQKWWNGSSQGASRDVQSAITGSHEPHGSSQRETYVTYENGGSF